MQIQPKFSLDNLKRNVGAITNPETRKDWLRGGLNTLDRPFPKMKASFSEAIKATAPGVAQGFGDTLAGKNTVLNKLPVVKNILPMAANTGQTIGSGVVDMASSVASPISRLSEGKNPQLLKNFFTGTRGASKVIGAGTPLFQAGNIASNLPFQIGEKDLTRRFAKGFTSGMSQTPGLRSEALDKNVNFLGSQIDSVQTFGSMVGFIKNPQNKKILDITSTIFPTKNTNVLNWLASTGVRGIFEDIALDYPDMPDDLDDSQKAKWLIKTGLEGALMEIGGQAVSQGGGELFQRGIKKFVKDEKQLAQVFDFIKRKIKGRAKSRLQPDTGEIEGPLKLLRKIIDKNGVERYQYKSSGKWASLSDDAVDEIEKLARDPFANLADLSAQKRKQVLEFRFLNNLDEPIQQARSQRVNFKQDPNNPRRLLRANSENMAGAVAGVEPYQDEEGNWKVRYDPEKGLIGIGLMAGRKGLDDSLKAQESKLGPELEPKTVVERMTEALKKAEKTRGKQEKLYTEARAEKLAKLLKARESVKGESGYIAELESLKGELPKVEYEAIRNNFNQKEIDELFNTVKQSDELSDWDKVTAQTGLAKILGAEGGQVPTKGELDKMQKVFGEDFTKTLLDKRPFFAKLQEAGIQIYNLPRSLMSGFLDFSATLRQNAMFATRHPIMTAKNFKQQLLYFANEDAYKIAMEEIRNRETYGAMQDAKLSFTDVGGDISAREEKFMSTWAEQIPGVGKIIKATGRAYTGFLNKMRADVFDDFYISSKNLGVDVNSKRFLETAGGFINNATGRGSLGKLERLAPILGQGFFSARALAATVNMLNPATYVKMDPAVRKEALKTWVSFLGTGFTILKLSELAGAEETEDDSASSDFGKIKIGNTRFNIWGTYQQIPVLLTRLFKSYALISTSGQRMRINEGYKPLTREQLLTRWLEMKQHPTLGYMRGLLSQQTPFGEEFKEIPELMDLLSPMMLGDAYDLYMEHGPIGLLALFPSILGIGSQTYGTQIPVYKKDPSGEPLGGYGNIELRNRPGLSETVYSKITGDPITTIEKDAQQSLVERKKRESMNSYLSQERNRLRKKLKAGVIDEEEFDRQYNQILKEVGRADEQENVTNFSHNIQPTPAPQQQHVGIKSAVWY